MEEKNKRKREDEEKKKEEKKEEKKEDEEYYEQLARLSKIKEAGEKLKKEIDRGKEAAEKFWERLKQYEFISAIGMAIPFANKIIEENLEEEQLARLEEAKKETNEIFHIFIIVPEEKAKELQKLSMDAIKATIDLKPKLWLHFFTPKELWQLSFDGKYEFLEAIAMAIPIHDTGILGALRVASIHKMMVINKFERYVVSYVLAGSLVRGQATQTSDVDVFVIIDDTDVKRMSRFELRERLRSIIYSYAIEANERANSKNKLSPQIYILTEFWEAVKEAHPVIFTFIRDGVPLYDRGAFMPWKLLLKMGKIKPSPEAIEMFMSLGEKVVENVKKKMTGLITEDIYWGVITPSQATLMLYGIAPPTPKETVAIMQDIFVEKEKLLEKKYIDILKKIVEIYKKYEHEEKIEIKGKELDFLLEQVNAYIERLKLLALQLEEKAKAKTIEELDLRLSAILQGIFGKKSMEEYLKLLEESFVKKGLISKYYLEALKNFIELKKKKEKVRIEKKGKEEKEEKERLEKTSFELLRKDLLELIRELKEWLERKEIFERRKVVKIKYKENERIVEGELVFGKEIFLIPDILKTRIEKFITEQGKFIESSLEELQASSAEPSEIKLSEKIIKELERRFKNLEIFL
ncbi:MAG: nucleotidyltransferase domain-containing protein [Candidatus Pacearchaeota archaeon]